MQGLALELSLSDIRPSPCDDVDDVDVVSETSSGPRGLPLEVGDDLEHGLVQQPVGRQHVTYP
jgi:hypothetical protein